MMEASIGGLPDIAENGIINASERRYDDPEIQLSDDLDIQMVDR